MPTVPAKKQAIEAASYTGSGREVEYRVEGGQGLMLVVAEPKRNGTSTKTWRFTYSWTGGGRRTTRKRRIGTYPLVDLKNALRIALVLRERVDQGVDIVAAEKAADAVREAASLTFEDLVGEYIAARRSQALKSIGEIERALKRNALKVIGHKSPAEITRQDIEAVIDPLAKDGKLAMARHVLTYLKGLYNYCRINDPALGERYGITSNPAELVNRSTKGGTPKYGKPQVRERALKDDEVAALLAYLADENRGLSQAARNVLRLLLLTGQRSSEVIEMPIAELDLKCAEWLLPAQRAKNDKGHLVPLSEPAVAILRDQIGDRRSGFVFPHRDRPAEPMDSRTPGRAMERLLKSGRLEMAPWSPHDLRRTCETGMARLRVPKEVRDRVLNHVDGSVGGRHYNVHDYADEKREALEKWSAHVMKLAQ